jgi:adenosine deaminase
MAGRTKRIFGVLIGAAALACVATAHADEAGAAAMFDRIAAQPARLRVFLQAMPKGGDLHNHLGGGAYAEQYIDWAAEKGMCVSRKALGFASPPCEGTDLTPAKDLGRRDEELYRLLIEAMSTRAFGRGVGANDRTGHEDFFDTFEHFSSVSAAMPGAMLASARQSAAANNLIYVEPSQDPRAIVDAARLAASRPWNPGDFEGALAAIAPALPDLVIKGIAETDAWEADAARRLGCDTTPDLAPCKVTIRYQAYALRGLPPPVVFGQLGYSFALADKDPRYVGINIVMPEDGPVAMADFDLHMRMLRFFHARYPKVKLSLHAGELDLGLVPPAGLSHHIRDSIEIAGASRIGHGVDIPYETDAPGLLARMARERIAVEINLTSNDTILGVRGARHPLALYRAAGVPVVLATDDEGVARSDMTNEYLRAAAEQGLRYPDLKQIARAGIEYAFLPGASLWQDGAIGLRAAPCRAVPLGSAPPARCAAFLAASEKAREQWRLEGDFRDFENRIVTLKF